MGRREQVVELGDHRYTVTPQKIGRLKHELGDALGMFASEEAEAGGLVDQLGGQAHAVLAVFIDGLMPRHEWLGYASEDAMREDRYEPRDDRSPDPDQIVTAFEAVMKANRIDLVKHLQSLVGADFFQAAARKVLADALTGPEDSTTVDSPSSSSPATPPTTSTPSLTVLRTGDQHGGEYEIVTDDPSAGSDSNPRGQAASGG
jgi:hypothetical protein